ncbi:pyridoxal phosphate-dependent aminotransferase [Acidaminobacter hydrogenoformans]|uniref:histidinol-phosphate transaminase n=1 Tax=Acidaminobacter hydrogenoformans DSM 2784 TaxID=1120920 RepID=A0A1G5S1N8_9FIRM|nr:histidinol-phosphate transaminase [Acidaminobacter hydrogenoformans]SCZ80302.1 histidinol-phosphate aminotransferase [Acidaminobacter hydrogenoformans DSM 2784]
MIDLSANECPYPPSPKVLRAVSASLETLNRYGTRDQQDTLKTMLAKLADGPPGHLLTAHGTDALIAPILTQFSKDRAVVTTSPTHFGNLGLVKLSGGKLKRIQLRPPDFRIDWQSLMTGPQLILLSRPNSPTGQNLITRTQLIELLEQEDTLVVVDEAGFDYCQETVIDLVSRYPNLAVTRTLDKAYGLAGLRVSWMAAGATLLKAFENQPPTIGQVACAAAIAALEDPSYARTNAGMTVSERNRMAEALEALGFQVFDSKSNFLLVKSPLPELGFRLRQEGILIEDFSGVWIEGYFRVTIGSKEENDALLAAVSKL